MTSELAAILNGIRERGLPSQKDIGESILRIITGDVRGAEDIVLAWHGAQDKFYRDEFINDLGRMSLFVVIDALIGYLEAENDE